MVGELGQYVDAVERRNKRTLDGLDAVITMMGGIPGKKVLLYLGEGVELQPGIEMAYRVASQCTDMTNQVMSLAGDSVARDLRAVAANANAYRVTIYSFDAAGSRVEETIESDLLQIRAANQQDSLNLLSRETGGALFRNVGDPRFALERISQDAAHSYSIAYVPGKSAPGELRKVEVELVGVQQRKARVSHRRAIRTLPSTDRLVASLFAALWLGYEENSLNMEASASAETEGVRVSIRLPKSELVGLSRDTATNLRIFLMARDPLTGVRSPPKEYFEPITSELLETGDPAEPIEFSVHMKLPKGTWEIAAGLVDEATSRRSVVRLRVPM